MKFWDSSALLPLLLPDQRSALLVALLQDDPGAAVWWATPVECISALCRLERDQRLSPAGAAAAAQRLLEAAKGWTEVPPVERVRDQAVRLLRVHPLRAAQALPLAAAIVLSDYQPSSLPFVTLDQHLAHAAEREGFEVLGASRP